MRLSTVLVPTIFFVTLPLLHAPLSAHAAYHSGSTGLLWAPVAAQPDPRAQDDAGKNGDQGTIETYAAALRKVGPEARVERENAVQELVIQIDPAAHAVLQKYVGPGPDPDGVRRLVLGQLPMRMRSPNDPAFGISRNINARALLRSYVAPLTAHFGADVKAPEAVVLRGLARAALMSIPTRQLRDATNQLLEAGTQTMRAQALRAAGECRDVGIASIIARYLDDKDLRDVARKALYALTYTQFENARSFAEWQAVNGDRNYVELVEGAARRGKQRREAQLRAANDRYIAAVVALVDVLASSNQHDRWQRIRRQVFPATTDDMTPAMVAAVTRAALGKLREVLAATATVANGQAKPDRLAFLEALTKRLDAGGEPEEYALLLEVASYVCGPPEAPERVAQQKRLEAGLRHGSAAVKLGALRGLRRFFSPGNRQRVLQVAVAAQGTKDLQTLATAVATLQSEGWTAPAPDASEFDGWMRGVQGLLLDEGLPVAVRLEVIPVLCLSDDRGKKLARSFNLLLDMVGQEVVPADMRRSVLLRLTGLIPADQPARDKAAKEFVDRLVGLQSDSVSVEIRRAASILLMVPENVSEPQQKILGNNLVVRVGLRLLKETDERVFAELIRVLKAQSEVEGLVSVVNTRLRNALQELGGKPESANLVAAVTEGLRHVALKKGRTVAEWTATCEELLRQRDRLTVRNILTFHLRGQGPRPQAEGTELQQRIWRIVIQTARLAPDDTDWSATTNRAEAEMVHSAVDALVKAGVFAKAAPGDKPLDDSRTRLTYLRCLQAIGKSADVIKHAAPWLEDTDTVLVDRDRDEARILLARAFLAETKPARAWTESGLQTVNGALLEVRLDVQSAIAQTLQQRKNLKAAVEVAGDAVNRTPPAAEKYWPRFRAHLEYRFELNAKAGSELLRELNEWVAKTPNLSASQKKEVESLKSRLLGSARPPR